MGKNGKALQEKKLQREMTVTRAWLEDHDRQVREQAIRDRRKELEAEGLKVARKVIKEWTDDDTGELDMRSIIQYMLAVTIKVLVDKFGWQTVPAGGKPDDKRHNIVKYALYVDDELEKLKNYGNIKDYSQNVIDNYGIGFILETETSE